MQYAFKRQIGIGLRPIYNSVYADVVKKSFKRKLKKEKLSLAKKTIIFQPIKAIEENRNSLRYKDYDGRLQYGIFLRELKLTTNLKLTFYMQLIIMQKQ